MQCDICGSDEELFLADIEGTNLNVCKKCSNYGNVIKKIKKHVAPAKTNSKNFEAESSEIIQTFVDNFNNIIKEKREKLGLKQKELAKIMAEKESVIHKLESGTIEPDLQLARKIEKVLKIKIIEEQEVKKTETKHNTEKLTIGDLIKR